MVRLNRTRMDYLEKFQAMIDAYNAGQPQRRGVLRAAGGVRPEPERGRAAGASPSNSSEEELALFDLLTKPEHRADRRRNEARSRRRPGSCWPRSRQEKLVLDWRKRQQARAEVRVTIEEVLDQGLPEVYTPELFEQKTAAVFQHVYDGYYGAAERVRGGGVSQFITISGTGTGGFRTIAIEDVQSVLNQYTVSSGKQSPARTL